jgi:hypothetical protein
MESRRAAMVRLTRIADLEDRSSDGIVRSPLTAIAEDVTS